MPPSKPPLIPVVVGPTGIGKTVTAARMAAALGGEVVVADSRQVYRWLDIATNKPRPEERVLARHHGIDLVDPVFRFSAGEWLMEARDAIEDILSRGARPVIEGGTMMWVDALTEGFTLTGVPPDPHLRRWAEEEPLAALATRVRELDPTARVDFGNRRRVIRALEVLAASGRPLQAARERRPPPWRFVRIGLRAPDEVIAQRLAERSREQVGRGLVAETAAALEWGVAPDAPVLTGIGYAEAVAHLRGDLSTAGLPLQMAASNRRYARRQLRWFAKHEGTRWFEAVPDPLPDILSYLEDLL